MDEQKTIRSEIEQAREIIQQVFLRLSRLDRTDERVMRTGQALSALERVSWTMTSDPGRLGPAAKPFAILIPPTTGLGSQPPADSRNDGHAFVALRQPVKPGMLAATAKPTNGARAEKAVQSAPA